MAIASLDDALKAVAQVAPVAREYCQKAEDTRRLPVEVVDAIEAAGLWRVFSPKGVGGDGLIGLIEQFEIIRSMAYEDTSAGWILFICGGTPPIVAAKLPPEGRAEVFANGVVPMAGVFNPGGSAQLTPDGLSVTGRWPFSSGVEHAAWLMANTILLDESGAPRPGEGGLPEIRSVVVPADAVTVVDDWHVAGLRGTGSMTFTMESVIVPEYRSFPFFAMGDIEDPKYRLPLFTLISPAFPAMAVGLAERALDEIRAILPTRVGPPTFQPASEDPIIQFTLGQAIASIRGAREACRAMFDRIDGRVAAGENLDGLRVEERSDLRQNCVWAVETCRDAVGQLFRLGGASSIYEPGALQRVWRDINVVGQHLFLRASAHEIAGKLALGIEYDSPFT